MTGPSLAGKRVVHVAAYARNRVIGNGPDIPWKLPGEQAQFKELTWGHTLLMGRTTFDSIGRPLPGRTTIVLTRDPTWAHQGVLVAHSLDEALAFAAQQPGDLMVAGGAEVYAALMPHATHQVLTEVDLEPEGDVLYPELVPGQWTEVRRERHDGYDRVWLERTPA